MLILRSALFTVFFVTVFVGSSFSQSVLKGVTSDSSTGQPLPFVNIQIKETTRGTISDLQGFFSLQLTGNEVLQFSCVGYKTLQTDAGVLVQNGKVALTPKPVNLAAVTVTPGMNPAVGVMRKVVENAPLHNPDINFDYRSILYHKMVFSFEKPRLAGLDGKSADFLLIESVSEKNNKAPSQHSERMISGRVSGFKEPSLAFIPAQIQPFSFYSSQISLLGENYVNPVSPSGLRHYNFILEDTVWTDKSDTILYISFFPRRGTMAKALRGSLHIQVPNYVVRTVAAATAHDDAPIMLSILQNYRQHENGVWFPEQLESRLRLTSPALNSPVIAVGKSYVATVDFEPQFDRKSFAGPDFSDEGITADGPEVGKYRMVPLTASDSAVITLLDSLSRHRSLDEVIALQRDLLRGYLGMGKINLDIRKLIGYNDFEGFKAGVGLETNDRMWKRYTLGGYAVYGFGDREWKYGGNITRNLKNEGYLRLWGHDDVAETGAYSFLAGSESGTYEYLGSFLAETMDRSIGGGVKLKMQLARNLEGLLEYSYSDVKPQIPYLFFDDINPWVAAPYVNHEVGAKLKWTPGQRQVKNVFGLFRQPANMPVFWLNVAAGRGNGDYDYRKAEMRIHQDIRLQSWSITGLRAEAGIIEGTYHDALLYSVMGTRKKLGLEIPYSFATMRPNEFAVSEFANIHLRHSMMPFTHSAGKLKPEISLMGAAGWSNKSVLYRTYHRGYYETGVAIDNILNLVVVKYGFGVHYRIGPYRHSHECDNWAFNLSVRMAL